VDVHGHPLLAGKPIAETIANYEVAGKLVLVDVPRLYIPNALAIGSVFKITDPWLTAPAVSTAPWLDAQSAMPEIESALASAHAAGLVAVLPYADPSAANLYAPLDGIDYGLPAVYLDTQAGAEVKTALAAHAATSASLVLTAVNDPSATMDNLVGTVPSNASRVIVVSSHTDGANALEDDGPAAIQALVDYFCKIPQDQRPATLRVVMDGGHFSGNAGLKHYVAVNGDALKAEAVAEIEIEHLGARSTRRNRYGRFVPDGKHEPVTITVSTLGKPQVEAAKRFSSRTVPSVVASRCLLSFGAGAPFTGVTDVIQIIAGPHYLLQPESGDGNEILDRYIDYAMMRREILNIGQMILDLGNTPDADFRQTVSDPSGCMSTSGATAGT
jgi:hypothetical protein